MRALVIVSEMPPIASGVARCADRLVRGLQGRGHEVHVLSTLDIPRLTLGEFRLSSFPLHWRRIARELPSYDVVNLHGPAPTMSDDFLAFSRTLSRIERPPVVYTHHCSIDIDHWALACRLYNRLHRTLARGADHIITTSESYRGMIEGPRCPGVSIVPWGVDFERYARPRPPAGSLSRLRVLFVGQMRPYKGISNLLAAVDGLPDVELTIVGGGPLEQVFRQEAEAVASRNVAFLGRVSDDHLERLYAEHDVVALPSTTRAEAFGMVLLEGMAAGCVPVASDLPGVRDLVGSTGVLVGAGDVPGLRQALATLASRRERVQFLGDASQARARSMSWEAVARRYEQIFQETLLAWRDRCAVTALPRSWSPPEVLLEAIRGRFGASWISLLLFDRARQPAVRAGWGRVPVDDLHRAEPRIAQYVARTRTPLLLDGDRDRAPTPVRDWLVREDVASALSVPVRSAQGNLVLNLSRGRDGGEGFAPHDLDALVRLVSARHVERAIVRGPATLA